MVVEWKNLLKKRLDGSGTEKVCSSTGIFWSVPFHYWTVQRFQKVLLEYFSASFLTGPDQRFKQNYRELFSQYQKTGVLNGTRFSQTSMGLSQISLMPEPIPKGRPK